MFQSFSVIVPEFSDREFDIRDYGGVGDGRTSNTAAFKKAMEAASAEGGRLIVPDGIWRTGPIRLLSNVELHLEDNAVLYFDKSSEEYPLIVTDYEGITRIRALSPIYAEGAENIAITGRGIINGNGHLWRPVKEFKLTKKQWQALLAQSPYVLETKEGGIWFPTESIYETAITGEIYPGDTIIVKGKEHEQGNDKCNRSYGKADPVRIQEEIHAVLIAFHPISSLLFFLCFNSCI